MDFIDRLKEAYENGKDSGFLDLKYSFYAMMLVERPTWSCSSGGNAGRILGGVS